MYRMHGKENSRNHRVVWFESRDFRADSGEQNRRKTMKDNIDGVKPKSALHSEKYSVESEQKKRRKSLK